MNKKIHTGTSNCIEEALYLTTTLSIQMSLGKQPSIPIADAQNEK